MPTKVGSITSLGRTGAKFVEVYLDGGEKIELSHALWEHVRSTYPPGQQLVFVERRGRIFHFVHWAGTPEEANEALARGDLAPNEVPPIALRNQPSDEETDVPGERGGQVEEDRPLAMVERRGGSDIDHFFAQLELLTPDQWLVAVLTFGEVRMSREDAQEAAWQSALEASRTALEQGEAFQVRSTTERAKAIAAGASPVISAPSPLYEAFRRAAGDMVVGAALSVLLDGHLSDESISILYEPFRILIIPLPQVTPDEDRLGEPDWVALAQSAYLGLAGSATQERMEHFVKQLWEIAERAPFPELAVQVRLLAEGEDEESTEQGLFGVMDWIQSTLEEGGSRDMRSAVAKSLSESRTWSQRRP